MTKDDFTNVANIKYQAGLAVVLIFVCFINARGQNQAAVTDSSSKEPAVKTEPEKTIPPAVSKSRLKVTFDETAPGVVYIESNGEKIRIDTNSKQQTGRANHRAGRNRDGKSETFGNRDCRTPAGRENGAGQTGRRGRKSL
jgi:hypothetical protein